jgi:gamma-glutamyltranspeptidase/glutathione hydrolase
MGSALAQGTGVLPNNEPDDFAAAGRPNAYGLVGGDANAGVRASGRCHR